nr:MAG TPA: hypothetical protein [Caudoviricetes sp.]
MPLFRSWCHVANLSIFYLVNWITVFYFSYLVKRSCIFFIFSFDKFNTLCYTVIKGDSHD